MRCCWRWLCCCCFVPARKFSSSRAPTVPHCLKRLPGKPRKPNRRIPRSTARLRNHSRRSTARPQNRSRRSILAQRKAKTRCYGYGIRLIFRRRCSGWHISAMSAGFLRRGLRQVFPRGFGKPMRHCCWNTPSSRRSMRSTSSAVRGIYTASCRLTKTQQL